MQRAYRCASGKVPLLECQRSVANAADYIPFAAATIFPTQFLGQLYTQWHRSAIHLCTGIQAHETWNSNKQYFKS